MLRPWWTIAKLCGHTRSQLAPHGRGAAMTRAVTLRWPCGFRKTGYLPRRVGQKGHVTFEMRAYEKRNVSRRTCGIADRLLRRQSAPRPIGQGPRQVVARGRGALSAPHANTRRLTNRSVSHLPGRGRSHMLSPRSGPTIRAMERCKREWESDACD